MEQSEPLEPHRPRWQEWCEKNSQPKEYNFPRRKRELTRWQKRGPMTRRDWVRFYNWAATNAVSREIPDPMQTAVDKRKGKKKTKNLSELFDRLAKLCIPKNRRSKYKYPPKPVYTYSPKIDHRKPAHHDPGRPFPKPKVPKRFYHPEVEIDFWNDIRFPVVRAALKYQPSDNVLALAQPRQIPATPHCPIPEKPPEYIPPRKRMTYRQWLEHQRRLEYLAKPITRPYYEYLYG